MADNDIHVNRTGYWVTYRANSSEDRDDRDIIRTYACTDLEGLYALIDHLTGRPTDSFPLDSRGLPIAPNVTIAYPLHIYS